MQWGEKRDRELPWEVKPFLRLISDMGESRSATERRTGGEGGGPGRSNRVPSLGEFENTEKPQSSDLGVPRST